MLWTDRGMYLAGFKFANYICTLDMNTVEIYLKVNPGDRWFCNGMHDGIVSAYGY